MYIGREYARVTPGVTLFCGTDQKGEQHMKEIITAMVDHLSDKQLKLVFWFLRGMSKRKENER